MANFFMISVVSVQNKTGIRLYQFDYLIFLFGFGSILVRFSMGCVRSVTVPYCHKDFTGDFLTGGGVCFHASIFLTGDVYNLDKQYLLVDM